MNNTTNNSKTNNTEIGNNINRSSQLNANNDQDTNLKSHSIYRRFLPGLLMLLLGVVILSAPVAANAQITKYTLPNAVYVASPYSNDVLAANSPTINAYPGTHVGFVPRLYKLDLYRRWIPKSSSTSIIRTSQTTMFNMTQLLDGYYRLAYELYYWDGAKWVLQVNQWAPGIDAYDDGFYGLSYTGFFEELNYPDLFSPYYYY
jgi:hypothetical protein